MRTSIRPIGERAVPAHLLPADAVCFLDGEMETEERRRAELHIADCGPCAALVQVTRQHTAMLTALGDGIPVPPTVLRNAHGLRRPVARLVPAHARGPATRRVARVWGTAVLACGALAAAAQPIRHALFGRPAAPSRPVPGQARVPHTPAADVPRGAERPADAHVAFAAEGDTLRIEFTTERLADSVRIGTTERAEVVLRVGGGAPAVWSFPSGARIDNTAEHGRYSVELPPGVAVVQIDAGGTLLAHIHRSDVVGKRVLIVPLTR